MKPTLTYEEILTGKQDKNIGFVDVRSPGEYQLSTIPGAVNIPVLDNEARTEVGKLYVSGKTEEAKGYGVAWISSQLPDIYESYQMLLEEYDELVIFCSRGGMRSNSIFSLLKALGMPVSRLSGGYKGYRQYINRHLDEQLEKVNFITLYGLSGSGKTEILKHLATLGAHTLDLEACANHRGSLLGSVGLSEPHSQKMFESHLFEAGRDWKEGDWVFTEGESRRIGKAIMPASLVSGIRRGKKIQIDAPLAKRVSQIRTDYVSENNSEELIAALEPLKSFVKEERILLYQEQLQRNEADAVIENLLLSYYDPRYNYHKKQTDCVFMNVNNKQTAHDIWEWQKENRSTKR